MIGNKSEHSRRIVIRGLLVMAVIFIVMSGWGAGEYLGAWKIQPLQAASVQSLSFQNKLPAAVTQHLPVAATAGFTAAIVMTPSPQASAVSQTSNPKTVYLTFDDGPSNVTPKVLEILQREGVRATFFVIGNQAQSHPEWINAIWEQGNAIGNHTYNHNYSELYKGFTAFWSQIKRTEEIIRGITGVRPQLIRAPGGTFGHFDNTYFYLLKQAGYLVTDWTVDSGDSKRKGVPASEILQEATTGLTASKVVLLLHDGGGHAESAKALPEIINRYKAAGYVFDILDDQVKPVQFRVSPKTADAGRSTPSKAWIASNITPNAELFESGKPLVLEVGKLETRLNPGEYVISKGQYMVPLRAVIERLGGRITWDNVNRSGKVNWNGTAVTADVENNELTLNRTDGVQEAKAARVELIGSSIWVSLRELLEIAGHPPLNISVTEKERRVKAL